MYPDDDQFLTAIGLFVPMPVSVGLLSGTFDYLAELREVSTMFMSWDSFNKVEHNPNPNPNPSPNPKPNPNVMGLV
jgi:hypothetical protein